MYVHEYARSSVFPLSRFSNNVPALKNRYLTLAATSKSTFPFVFKSEIQKKREIRILATFRFSQLHQHETFKEVKVLPIKTTLTLNFNFKFLRILLSNFRN